MMMYGTELEMVNPMSLSALLPVTVEKVTTAE